MSSFRFKVILFSLPLLLPIGRVELSGSAESDHARLHAVSLPLVIDDIQPEPRLVADDQE